MTNIVVYISQTLFFSLYFKFFELKKMLMLNHEPYNIAGI